MSRNGLFRARARGTICPVSDEGFSRGARDIRENTRVLRELVGEIREHRREFRAEYEAQRATLLAILGYLELTDPRNGPAPSG